MPRLRHVIATLLAMTPTLAAAEPVTAVPVTAMIAPEIRFHLTGPSEPGDLGLDSSTSDDTVGGLFASVAFPVSPGIAFGIHAGVASRRYGTEGWGLGFMEHWDNRRILVDVAAMLQLTQGRLWIAPWLGRHVTRRDNNVHVCERNLSSEPWQCHDSRSVEWVDGFMSYGATVGVDLVRIGAHNIAGFVDAQTGGAYSAISVGVGYRLDFGAAATRSASP